jgi:hypothetical protein
MKTLLMIKKTGMMMRESNLEQIPIPSIKMTWVVVVLEAQIVLAAGGNIPRCFIASKNPISNLIES